jgi:predicted nucleic acid-binding protein
MTLPGSRSIFEADHVSGGYRCDRRGAPHPENLLDKQIAATALIHDLTVVTRNTAHYEPTGVRIENPFNEPIELARIDP